MKGRKSAQLLSKADAEAETDGEKAQADADAAAARQLQMVIDMLQEMKKARAQASRGGNMDQS